MPRTRVVIQSRLNSSRLPGKAMLTIAGMPLIELVARRARRSGHEVVVATSEEQYDDRIARHLETVGVSVVRGSLDDVLGRFVQAIDGLAADDLVVRLTGDNPVADADLVDELIAALATSVHTYGRVDIERVPEGLGAEVFTAGALREAAVKATDPYDREHVTPWLRRTLGELLFVPDGCPADATAYRATVDTLGDYVRVASLFDGLADPVATPWLRLMDDLAARVDSSGVRVGAVTTAFGRLSRVVLSARSFDDGTVPERPAERAESLRSLVASAVERGVTHVDVGRSDGRGEELLRASAEPALVKRFGLVCRVAPMLGERTEDTVRGLAVEASVERSFATLGRRGVELLVFSGSDAAQRGWPRAQAYRDDGLTIGLGVVVNTLDDLSWALATPDVAWVEVAPDLDAENAPASGMLVALAARGCALASCLRGGRPPAWATTVIVTDRSSLDHAIGSIT